MRPTDKIIVRIQEAYAKNKGVRLSVEDVIVLAEGVFLEDICISEDNPVDWTARALSTGGSDNG